MFSLRRISILTIGLAVGIIFVSYAGMHADEVVQPPKKSGTQKQKEEATKQLLQNLEKYSTAKIKTRIAKNLQGGGATPSPDGKTIWHVNDSKLVQYSFPEFSVIKSIKLNYLQERDAKESRQILFPGENKLVVAFQSSIVSVDTKQDIVERTIHLTEEQRRSISYHEKWFLTGMALPVILIGICAALNGARVSCE